ncbi:hypothetical protein D3C78_1175020 [compost metagenome]
MLLYQLAYRHELPGINQHINCFYISAISDDIRHFLPGGQHQPQLRFVGIICIRHDPVIFNVNAKPFLDQSRVHIILNRLARLEDRTILVQSPHRGQCNRRCIFAILEALVSGILGIAALVCIRSACAVAACAGCNS